MLLKYTQNTTIFVTLLAKNFQKYQLAQQSCTYHWGGKNHLSVETVHVLLQHEDLDSDICLQVRKAFQKLLALQDTHLLVSLKPTMWGLNAQLKFQMTEETCSSPMFF